jgi:hypothetical protein
MQQQEEETLDQLQKSSLAIDAMAHKNIVMKHNNNKLHTSSRNHRLQQSQWHQNEIQQQQQTPKQTLKINNGWPVPLTIPKTIEP